MRLLAYCLMENHVHLVCVPEEEDSLAVCLRRTHGRYAQYFNARRQRSGHLWQSRFYSCPMDEMHLWAAIRYVELNPVRAGMVERAERYGYSSAAAHVSGRDEGKLLDMEFWRGSGAGEEWGERLRVAETGEELRKMRRATYAGSALGDEAFVAKFKELRKAKRGVVGGGGMWG